MRVVQHAFVSFADQRNWAMFHADLRNDWVLHLDADEVVTEELSRELELTLSRVGDEVAAFRMCRKTMFQGRWLKYSDGFPVWIMRLVRNGRAQFENCGHGEVAVPIVAGRMETIQEPFLHFAFSKGLEDWISRQNRYSTGEARLEYQQLADVSWAGLWDADKAVRRQSLRGLSRRLPLRPWLRFIYQYVLKMGFLDGRPGLDFCRMMAEYEGWIVLKRRELEAADSTPGIKH